jgi:DNA polymerase
VWVDLETQSAANLRQVGAKIYLRHPSTRLLSAVFLLDGTLIVWVPAGRGPKDLGDLCNSWDGSSITPSGCEYDVILWIDENPPDCVIDAIRNGATFIAHNAETFDALAWELLVGGPQPSWYDTIHCCRAAGLPAGLDRAAKAIGAAGKDEDGGRALRMLYTVKDKQPYTYPVGSVELWGQILRYNIQDVLALKSVYDATEGAGELDVFQLNSTINNRGVPVDLAFSKILKEAWYEHKESTKANVAELTDCGLYGDDMQSPAKVKAWLRKECGVDLQTLNRAAVEAMLADPDGFFGDTDDPRIAKAIAVIQARASAIRATPGKIDRLFSVADADSRVRNSLVYHGAHTGRWSGRDLQPHNFPRPAKGLATGAILAAYHDGRLTLDVVRAAAESAGVSVGDALATLMRPCIRAGRGKRLVVLDYASVEARGTAWIAKEQTALSLFADPSKDIYVDMARAIGSSSRQLGKIIVLGCGYGMGANKFAATCSLGGTDLSKAGVTAEECVKGYRQHYAEIPRCWARLNGAAHHVLKHGGMVAAGRCRFSAARGVMTITLPSGRNLIYRNARIEMMHPKWDPTGEKRPTIVYDTPHGFSRILYGGLLAENIVQAICRDLLADAMIRLETAGWPIVLHVHDEVVMEVDEGDAERCLHDAAILMSTPPDWAEEFPVRVEGFVTEHYGKYPTTIDAMKGVIL